MGFSLFLGMRMCVERKPCQTSASMSVIATINDSLSMYVSYVCFHRIHYFNFSSSIIHACLLVSLNSPLSTTTMPIDNQLGEIELWQLHAVGCVPSVAAAPGVLQYTSSTCNQNTNYSNSTSNTTMLDIYNSSNTIYDGRLLRTPIKSPTGTTTPWQMSSPFISTLRQHRCEGNNERGGT